MYMYVACAHLRSKKFRTLWCQSCNCVYSLPLQLSMQFLVGTSYICPSYNCPYNLRGSPMKTADDTSKTRCSNDGHHSAEANVWFEIVTIPKRSNSGLGKHFDVWINTDACPNWATTKLVQPAALWMWVNARKNRQWNAMNCNERPLKVSRNSLRSREFSWKSFSSSFCYPATVTAVQCVNRYYTACTTSP